MHCSFVHVVNLPENLCAKPSTFSLLPLLHSIVMNWIVWFNIYMKRKPIIKTKQALAGSLAVMAVMIGFAIVFQETFIALLNHPAINNHARFVHIAAVTLFFANAVVGIAWEQRSLVSGSKPVILHTYNTVAFLDSRLSSPLIILSVLGGLSLSVRLGELWQIGWLSVSFLLFLLSGVFWIVSDIPTQYKIKTLIANLEPEDPTLPDELVRLLKLRLWIGLAGVVPLVVVFILMVYKPEIKAVADWFELIS